MSETKIPPFTMIAIYTVTNCFYMLMLNCIILSTLFYKLVSFSQGMLTHWTKKIIIEEGHTAAQLVHILQLVFRHYKVYYPVRHHLIQHMVNSIQRLGLTPNVSHFISQLFVISLLLSLQLCLSCSKLKTVCLYWPKMKGLR